MPGATPACSSAGRRSRRGSWTSRKDKELTIVEDELDDISSIIAIIEELNDLGILAAVAVDPAGLGEFVEASALIGLTPEGKQVLGAPQGYAMMNAIKTSERKLSNGTLKHCASKLMAWCVANVKIEPTRPRSAPPR
jgi:phage terminase large subunit-like protein